MKKILYTLMAVAMVAFVGCDKGGGSEEDSSIKLTSTNHEMRHNDEFQIEATSNTPITYVSENEYHAEVSASGLVTGERVGDTNIVMTNGEDTKRVKITIIPISNLYPEADLDFGMTRSAVKAKLGEPDSETADGIGYTAYSNNAPILMCIFDGADKLISFSYMVKTSYSSELGTFLAERYAPIDIDGEKYAVLCANALTPSDVTILIAADVYNLSYWMVLYMPYTGAGTRSDISSSEIMKSINGLMGKM